MVVGFLREAAWQSTPKRSKTIAAQRLSSTLLVQATARSRRHSISITTVAQCLTSDVDMADRLSTGKDSSFSIFSSIASIESCRR
jgi:hypothetical protein